MFFAFLCNALGRRNLCDDLSARKPASCLVQGNDFPGSRVIGRTVNVGCQIVSLFVQTYYSALK